MHHWFYFNLEPYMFPWHLVGEAVQTDHHQMSHPAQRCKTISLGWPLVPAVKEGMRAAQELEHLMYSQSPTNRHWRKSKCYFRVVFVVVCDGGGFCCCCCCCCLFVCLFVSFFSFFFFFFFVQRAELWCVCTRGSRFFSISLLLLSMIKSVSRLKIK